MRAFSLETWLKNRSSMPKSQGFHYRNLEMLSVDLEKLEHSPIIGHHFNKINKWHDILKADWTCYLLDHTFEYDRTYHFIGLFKYHSIMASQEEVVLSLVY